MESAWVPAKRDFQAERDVVCVKGGFQAVRQHPLNVELKRETAAVAGKAAVPVVKKPVIVNKGKSPLDDPLSAFGTFVCGNPQTLVVAPRLLLLCAHCWWGARCVLPVRVALVFSACACASFSGRRSLARVVAYLVCEHRVCLSVRV